MPTYSLPSLPPTLRSNPPGMGFADYTRNQPSNLKTLKLKHVKILVSFKRKEKHLSAFVWKEKSPANEVHFSVFCDLVITKLVRKTIFAIRVSIDNRTHHIRKRSRNGKKNFLFLYPKYSCETCTRTIYSFLTFTDLQNTLPTWTKEPKEVP